MKVLAVDLSSGRGSAAAVAGRKVLAAASWDTAGAGLQQLFEALSRVLERAGWKGPEIELFAAGRGPGRYGGLRSSISALSALALPDGGKVRAVSSGEALALATAEREGAGDPVAVVGDARRGCLWYALFPPRWPEWAGQGEGITWETTTAARLAGCLPDRTLVVSPDWERLREPLSLLPRERFRVPDGPRYPDAETVARLAADRETAGLPPEPLTPLYIHPPV